MPGLEDKHNFLTDLGVVGFVLFNLDTLCLGLVLKKGLITELETFELAELRLCDSLGLLGLQKKSLEFTGLGLEDCIGLVEIGEISLVATSGKSAVVVFEGAEGEPMSTCTLKIHGISLHLIWVISRRYNKIKLHSSIQANDRKNKNHIPAMMNAKRTVKVRLRVYL